jgi:hypothetical protein
LGENLPVIIPLGRWRQVIRKVGQRTPDIARGLDGPDELGL